MSFSHIINEGCFEAEYDNSGDTVKLFCQVVHHNSRETCHKVIRSYERNDRPKSCRMIKDGFDRIILYFSL